MWRDVLAFVGIALGGTFGLVGTIACGVWLARLAQSYLNFSKTLHPMLWVLQIPVLGVLTIVLSILAGSCAYHLVSHAFLIPARRRDARLAEAERWRQEHLKRQEERQRLRAERKRIEEEQRRIFDRMQGVAATAGQQVAALPGILWAAGATLDNADRDFTETAYAPFWSDIDLAARQLGAYNEALQRIAALVMEFDAAAKTLASEPPPFPARHAELPDPRPLVARLAKTVRKAQCSINFTTIYELRRTNKILLIGFSSLEDALNRIGGRIEESLANLGRQVRLASDQTSNQRTIEAEVVVARLEDIHGLLEQDTERRQ